MPSLENLENELHVSKNVIKFLTQDLQAAQNEIRTLKANKGIPEIREGVGSKYSDASVQEMRAELRSLKESYKTTIDERDSLQELVTQYEAETKHSETEKAEQLHTMVKLCIQLSDQIVVEKEPSDMFNPASFMMDVNNIKYYPYNGLTIRATFNSFDSLIQKHVEHLWRNPDAIVLRLHSDGAWCHPSESYFLTLDPTYTYHPNEKNALNRLKPFPRRTSKDQTDLFYFDANDEVWKYHGIFVYVGSQTMTFRQAREELKISEASLKFVERQISKSDRQWVHKMCEEGVFKITCTGFRRMAVNGKLVHALECLKLGPVSISAPVPSSSKRKGASDSHEHQSYQRKKERR